MKQKIKITYNKYKRVSKTNPLGLNYDVITQEFKVKEIINGAYLLENGWFIDYEYSSDRDWTITKGERYISTCSKPIVL